jgi:hypothetical protein
VAVTFTFCGYVDSFEQSPGFGVMWAQQSPVLIDILYNRSKMLSLAELGKAFAFKISILCRIFKFLCLGIVSLPCE